MKRSVFPVFLDGVVLAYGLGVVNCLIHVNLSVAAYHGDDIGVVALWIVVQMTANTVDLLDVPHFLHRTNPSLVFRNVVVVLVVAQMVEHSWWYSSIMDRN